MQQYNDMVVLNLVSDDIKCICQFTISEMQDAYEVTP